MTATPAEDVSAAIEVNGEAHTSGTAASWNVGENTVEVTCTGDDMDETVYTVTVTRSAPPDPEDS